MKKNSLKEKLEYRLDSIMERGAVTKILLLFLATIIVSFIVGVLAALICGVSVGEGMWVSLMHTLDGGTLAGDGLDDGWNLFFMTFMTVFGLCFTGVLIGIINNSFEQKLDQMHKGTSKVMEKDHVVILGYSYTLFTIVESLIEANSNHPDQCIVVVGNEENEVMKDAIKAHIKDFLTTKVICRSGKVYEEHMLRRASVESARSIIINGRDDVHAIKALLALSSYLEKERTEGARPRICVVINDAKYLEAAKDAGGDNVKVIYGKDAISRVIAHACNQRGLCDVFDELFDYKQNELYCEYIRMVEGRTFREAMYMFEEAIPVGIYGNDKKVYLNPEKDRKIEKGDRLILFEEDDNSYKRSIKSVPDTSNIDTDLINESSRSQKMMTDLVILGQNDRLDEILTEYDSITNENAIVRIVDTAPHIKYRLSPYTNIAPEYTRIDDFGSKELLEILKGHEFNVLVLADYDIEYEDADSKSLLKMIELRKIARQSGIKFATTCEIRKSSNKRLAEMIGAENYVVSSNIGGLLSVQYSEEPVLYDVFDELLSAKGSEIYMKPAGDFVETGKEMTFNTVIEAAMQKDSICLGYRTTDPETGKARIRTCPSRNSMCCFGEGDTLIILSED